MNKNKSPYKYKAFISYAHKDKGFARWLHKGIENYAIPRTLARKHSHLPKNLKRSVFRDEEELASAMSLSDVLKHGLEESECLIVVCSPSAKISKWVEKEIQYFQALHGSDAKIFTIIKEGEPSEVIPPCLANNAEPLAIRCKA